MNEIKEYAYNLKGSDVKIELNFSEDVFYPTGTTKALIDAVEKRLDSPGKLLDLGCGSGVLGIVLEKLGLINNSLYASDLSQGAVDCSIKNAKMHKIPHDVRVGSLFEPWINEKFDYIVNDVSGVAAEVAILSPWFKNVPCASGADGTDLVVKVLSEAPNYLSKGGQFFFPVISFSKVDNILSAANKSFSNIERVTHNQWPLPDDMKIHTDKLYELKEKGHIEFEEKFGMIIWYTDIYVGSNS
jgi:methylase of polypeptide subunit release factors